MKQQKKIYVSVSGNDNNSGSLNEPLKTLAGAVLKVREIKAQNDACGIDVLFTPGEYATGAVKLTAEDSGSAECPIAYKRLGEGEVLLNGSTHLSFSDFHGVDESIKSRLDGDAKENVLVCDLKKYGISYSDIGPVYAHGAVNSASRYDGDTVGNNAELFFNDKRMSVARYPNKGFCKIADVTDMGDYGGTPGFDKRNPQGGTIIVGDDVAKRMAKWKKPETAWIFGYFYWDWADGSSPIEWIKPEESKLKMKYASHYGLRKDTEYYVYNVLEELDSPGEYFIDRENLLLYIYPTDNTDNPVIELSLLNDFLFEADGTSYLTFDGLTFSGARKDAIQIKGSNLSFVNCIVKNAGGWAMKLFGENNSVLDCEIMHTGNGGVALYGGNPNTLMHGNCIAKDNHIHNYSEVNKTATSGIEIGGCGNIISHNLIENSPQMAIWCGGAENLVEYNHIRNVVQQSNDAGALYYGRTWISYGTVIRYNLFEHIGNEHYFPVAIYWDDTLAGQTAYGNIIKNSSAKGFLVGGGRDNKIINNLIIDCDEYAIMYDNRGRTWHDKWLDQNNPYGLWRAFSSLDLDGVWCKKYPWLKDIHHDDGNMEDINYAKNPSRAEIKNNVIVYNGNSDVFRGLDGCLIEEQVVRLGSISNNIIYKDSSECLVENTFELNSKAKALLPEFERIPVEKIGRHKN